MNNDFEQQFTQNIRNMPAPQQPVNNTSASSKIPLIVAVSAVALAILESIILIIVVSNYFSIVDYYMGDDSYTEEDFGTGDDSDYVLNEAGELSAINDICKREDGSSYTFSINGEYKFNDSATSATTSGKYSIVRDSVIVLAGQDNTEEKPLYYDGLIVADGTLIYECGESTTIDSE